MLDSHSQRSSRPHIQAAPLEDLEATAATSTRAAIILIERRLKRAAAVMKKSILVGKKTPEAAGTILSIKIANRDLTQDSPGLHSQKSLNRHRELVRTVNQKATAITKRQRTISPASASLKAAAIAVKKNLTKVEAKVAAEKFPEATETVHLMRFHNATQKKFCLIITLS